MKRLFYVYEDIFCETFSGLLHLLARTHCAANPDTTEINITCYNTLLRNDEIPECRAVIHINGVSYYVEKKELYMDTLSAVEINIPITFNNALIA